MSKFRVNVDAPEFVLPISGRDYKSRRADEGKTRSSSRISIDSRGNSPVKCTLDKVFYTTKSEFSDKAKGERAKTTRVATRQPHLVMDFIADI